MLNKTSQQFLQGIVISLLSFALQAQTDMSLSTLFTTPQERQVINANRYKTDDKPVQRVVETSPQVDQGPREILKEEVKNTYKISGISINADGTRFAWINEQLYEDGSTLDDGIKVRINNRGVKSVTLVTPDGKGHTATSGETMDVLYVRNVE